MLTIAISAPRHNNIGFGEVVHILAGLQTQECQLQVTTNPFPPISYRFSTPPSLHAK